MKKGFTLVELLAVIVILAVILVIAVPQINNVIKETRKNSLGSTAKLIAAKAEEKEVENDALEKTETITCADLVKLDSNYGNCTVTKNASGKWEVTIVGSGKFSGYTCTGTKDNMECSEGSSNTPEYVYSFEATPYYEYTYTVTNESKCNTDLPGILRNTGWGEEYITSDVPKVCSNSSDVYNAASCSGDDCPPIYSTSEWFAEGIQYGDFAYKDISSFVGKNGSGELVNAPVEDYTELKYPETNEQAQVFIRWNGDETEFSDTSEKSVCTLYGGSLNCFEATQSAYETNKSKLTTLFGSSKCQIDVTSTGEESTPTYTSCTDGSWTCRVNVDGLVRCSAPDTACYIDINGSVNCSIPNPGITIPDPGTIECEPVIYPDGSWHCPGE